MLLTYDQQQFNKFVHFYKLEPALRYYHLWTNTLYAKHGYHSAQHTYSVLWALFCHFKNNQVLILQERPALHVTQSLTYETQRLICIAAIFHDFNYSYVSGSVDDYDDYNIVLARMGLAHFMQSYKEDLDHFSLVEGLIASTTYPDVSVDELFELNGDFAQNASSNPNFIIAGKLLRDADRSMPMVCNYLGLQFALYTVEHKAATKEQVLEMIANTEKYLATLKFDDKWFAMQWEEHNNSGYVNTRLQNLKAYFESIDETYFPSQSALVSLLRIPQYLLLLN